MSLRAIHGGLDKGHHLRKKEVLSKHAKIPLSLSSLYYTLLAIHISRENERKMGRERTTEGRTNVTYEAAAEGDQCKQAKMMHREAMM